MPTIEPNVLAILLATIVCFFFSYAWYTPLFGQTWAREMNIDSTDMPTGKLMRSMAMALAGTFLTVFVFSNNILAWTPSSWGLENTGSFISQYISAVVFTWLGFFVPQHLSGVAWAEYSWKLFGINAGHSLLMLAIAAGILMVWP